MLDKYFLLLAGLFFGHYVVSNFLEIKLKKGLNIDTSTFSTLYIFVVFYYSIHKTVV